MAAWVAVADEDEEDEGAVTASDGGDDADAASGSADAPAKPSAKSSAKGADGDEDGPKAPADRATAVFGALRPKADGGSEASAKADGADEAGEGAEASGKGSGVPADRATAVFRTVPPKADDAAEAPAKAAEGDGKARTSAKADEASGKGSDAPADRATAVFRTVPPKSGDAAETPAKDDAKDTKGAKATKATKAAKAPAKDAAAPADQATAVFGAVRPEAGSGSEAPAKGEKAPADQATAVFRAVRPKGDDGAEAPAKDTKDTKDAKDAKAAKGGEDVPADRATAAFGVVPPKKNGKAAASVDQPTELLKAPEVKPEVKPAAKAGGKGKTPAESDSERTSQFVPLKSLDGAPAKSEKAAEPAAAKPAIPVSVTPPAPQKAQPKGGPGQDGAAKGAAAAPEVPAQPAAPLDLLAQLTNTPPPPDTPARTAMRRVKIYAPLVVLLLIVFCAVQAFRPLPDTKLSIASAKATFTFDGEKFAMPWPGEGQAAAMVQGVGSLGTYGEEKPVPTASVAKVMTAYVILKNHPLQKGDKGPDIEVDAEAEQESNSSDESRVPLRKGEKFSEYDMLQMLLIPSGNNAARLLARWDAQTRDAFVAKMNDAAKELGMSKTTYTDPSGFDKTTVSTAVDQLKLAEAVMKNEVFREIVAKTNTDVPNGPHLNNNNDTLLLKVGVLGIKTGSSTPAGGTLMWAAKRTVGGKEHMILGATMDQHFKGGPDPNAENSLMMVKNVSYKMIKAVQDNLAAATIVKKGDVVGYVEDGLGGKTPVVATKDLKGAGWPGMTAKLTIGKGAKPVPHTAKAGTEVGELTVGSGTGAMKVPVALQKELVEPSFGAKLTRLG
ncbi:serine hydrolase [Streptomyces sp. HU2014]|uniref:D-alanyl-D-alanine carboxypeptidase n=1 Tax=Streptomyces sp. HU2014 TaxID=2939414 RepID=UPI00200BFA00|nr:serine hydrolase [Streptomyces sp. HU2014]UQI43200.1 serine hydrolase [Streptomyces sp. HU2014]